MAEDRKMTLRDADRTMSGAVARTLDALDVPDEDLAVAELARQLAETIDAMPAALRPTMVAQTGGALLKVLADLEARARKRRAAEPPRQLDALERLRDEHARFMAPGKRSI